MKQTILSVVMAVFLAMCLGNAATGEDAPSIVQLPAPAKTGGMPLADALAARRSTRSFADTGLSPQQLSDLLWATAGVNRDDDRTTYPVAMGRKDMMLWDDSNEMRDRGEVWGCAHAGAMMQNAYLHAAAQNWSAVVRGLFDGEKLKTLLTLAPKQRVVLTQSIGPRG